MPELDKLDWHLAITGLSGLVFYFFSLGTEVLCQSNIYITDVFISIKLLKLTMVNVDILDSKTQSQHVCQSSSHHKWFNTVDWSNGGLGNAFASAIIITIGIFFWSPFIT